MGTLVACEILLLRCSFFRNFPSSSIRTQIPCQNAACKLFFFDQYRNAVCSPLAFRTANVAQMLAFTEKCGAILYHSCRLKASRGTRAEMPSVVIEAQVLQSRYITTTFNRAHVWQLCLVYTSEIHLYLLCVFRSPISREVCCSRELSTRQLRLAGRFTTFPFLETTNRREWSCDGLCGPSSLSSHIHPNAQQMHAVAPL